MKVALIIPALNEAESIGHVVAEAASGGAEVLIVVDNGSTDDTAEIASGAGALVVSERRRGYGYACSAGFAAAGSDVDICAFMDGDGSDDGSQLSAILQPIRSGEADLVLGRRVSDPNHPNAMLGHQRLGNALTCGLIRLLYGVSIHDLPSFRAIRRGLLKELQMREMTYGWPVEMVVKCARRKRRIVEVPVVHRARLGGRSKVSGTVRGTLMAAYYLPTTAIRYAWKD